MAFQRSAQSASAATVVIDDLDINYPRHTVAISYFDDPNYTIPSASPTGTLTVEGLTEGAQSWTAFIGSPIDTSSPGAFASGASPFSSLRVTPNALSGTSFYQVTIVSNEP